MVINDYNGFIHGYHRKNTHDMSGWWFGKFGTMEFRMTFHSVVSWEWNNYPN